MKKTTQLKNMINSSKLEFIMESHNGLSAKIVEQAGFKGIWGSGLTISAALGVRDNNEASWTQVLEVLEFMSDATTIPILLDGDTGYGNFNNMRRLVNKLEQRNIAGVCIEDKIFPKTNSFIGGEAQPLADVDEFCGKIKAAKDCQQDSDFVVVARVEAFIAGWSLNEAMERAEKYRQAGADAILVHSKKSTCDQIECFMKEWANRHPIVIVPTKYYSTPTDKFRALGINLVIWANHNLRTSIRAMQKVSKQIFEEQTLINVEDRIVKVSEVFRLQGADELKDAEKKYLPATGKNVNAVILAASKGDNFAGLTDNLPKALLKVNGKSILESQIETLNFVGVKDISIVRGFEKNKINFVNVSTIDNDNFSITTELYSLYLAMDQINGDTLISYGDIVFKSYVVSDLLNDSSDIVLVADADYQFIGGYKDFIQTDIPYSKKTFFQKIELKKISSKLGATNISGEFIGIWKVNFHGAQTIRNCLEKLSKQKDFNTMRMSDLFNEILKEHKIAVRFIKGSWLDVDSIVDLQKVGELSSVGY